MGNTCCNIDSSLGICNKNQIDTAMLDPDDLFGTSQIAMSEMSLRIRAMTGDLLLFKSKHLLSKV